MWEENPRELFKEGFSSTAYLVDYQLVPIVLYTQKNMHFNQQVNCTAQLMVSVVQMIGCHGRVAFVISFRKVVTDLR